MVFAHEELRPTFWLLATKKFCAADMAWQRACELQPWKAQKIMRARQYKAISLEPTAARQPFLCVSINSIAILFD